MGDEAIARGKRPLYLMIKPLPSTRERLIRLCAAFDIESGYSPERWHSTLLPLGESAPPTIDKVHRALEQLHAEPFQVAFDHIEGDTLKPRKGQRAPGILQRALARRIAASGLELPPYRFSLHLNLKYGGASDRRAAVPPIAWPVTEIILVESTGGRHIDRGRWPLARRQGAFDF